MSKRKAEKILFRGASFTGLKLSVIDGNCIAEIHVDADITTELAERMDWGIYTDGHLISGLEGSTRLSGELILSELSMQFNMTNSDEVECRASKAGDFKLARRKADAGGIETRLQFTVHTADWKTICDCYGLMGQADGAFTIELPLTAEDLQPTLDEQPHLQTAEEDDKEEDDKPKASRSRTGALAPKATMERVV